jgi:hypothetical protein
VLELAPPVGSMEITVLLGVVLAAVGEDDCVVMSWPALALLPVAPAAPLAPVDPAWSAAAPDWMPLAG